VFIDPVLIDSSVAQTTAESLTTLLPEFSGVIIGTTCMLQMLLSMLLDSRYDRKLMRYYIWIIWYPLGFWIINMLTIIVAIPKTLFRKKGKRARWVSPDRGIGL
jgi:biofilm PGA synthesis N-glycosyltransferase PgaC